MDGVTKNVLFVRGLPIEKKSLREGLNLEIDLNILDNL